METGFQLFPEQASTAAVELDYLYFFLIAVSVFFTLLISFSILAMIVRYRRGGGGGGGARPPRGGGGVVVLGVFLMF
jgi:heme/copper-type cytochrome/quinol oxidase subunit 2